MVLPQPHSQWKLSPFHNREDSVFELPLDPTDATNAHLQRRYESHRVLWVSIATWKQRGALGSVHKFWGERPLGDVGAPLSKPG